MCCFEQSSFLLCSILANVTFAHPYPNANLKPNTNNNPDHDPKPKP